MRLILGHRWKVFAFLLVATPVVTLAQATLAPLLVTGPSATRINIVLLSEGYTERQLPKFLTDAGKIVTRLLTVAPYQEYAAAFNAYAISVASKDSGADHPLSNDYRDTFFGSTFNSYAIDRLLTIPPNDRDPVWAHGQGRVDSLLELLMPEYDIACVVVNDPTYGGSGGSTLVVSTNTSSAEIAIHELGHGFAGLGDEYESAYPGFPDLEEPNTTRETRRDYIKWNRWILESTPIPTPAIQAYASQVGLFEGAHYQAAGWFRPKLNCMMRSLASPFCEVCRQQLVLSVYRLVHPIESHQPFSGLVALRDTQSVVLSIVPMVPSSHAIMLQWLEDGKPVGEANSMSYVARASDLGNGSHRLGVRAFDSTEYVRYDLSGALRDSVFWTVTVSGSASTAAHNLISGPVQFALSQNFPNPFNPSTVIQFSVPCASTVTLTVYDLLGREVGKLLEEDRERGTYQVSLNGDGLGLSSGIYFCRMEAMPLVAWPGGGFVGTRRLVMVR